MDANKYMTQEALQHITNNVAYIPMNMDKEIEQ
jgi:hypothetical protein